MTAAGQDTRHRTMLRRGFILEYITLGWNVVGIVVLAITAITARSVALAGFGLDSLIQSTIVLAAGYRPAHSPAGIAWTAVTAAAMFALAAGKARADAALGWWWADPAAGYILVYYAGREVAEIFRPAHR